MKKPKAGRQAGVSGQSSSPIGRAVAELETEKANLLARVEKVDQAIASLRALFHLPADRSPMAPSTAARVSFGSNVDIAAKIRAALKDGALSPGALATAVGIERSNLRHQLRALEAEGVVVSTGTTASRRIALKSAAAKEGL